MKKIYLSDNCEVLIPARIMFTTVGQKLQPDTAGIHMAYDDKIKSVFYDNEQQKFYIISDDDHEDIKTEEPTNAEDPEVEKTGA